MTRLVELDATGPRKLDPDDLDPEKGDVAVCRCGLSGSFPFCDGSHRATAGEADDELYAYERLDDEGASAGERDDPSDARRLRRRRVERVVLAEDSPADEPPSDEQCSDGPSPDVPSDGEASDGE